MASVVDCAYCIHQRKEKIDNWLPCCDAFPNGMPLPTEFDYSKVKYIKECNNGIGYEEKTNML